MAQKKEYRNYTEAPFVRARLETGDLMFLVVVALLPCAGVGIYHYGLHSALLIGISVGTAIAAEFICDLGRNRRSSIWDYSCVVTGLIGGLILPPSAPLWYAAFLSALAIVLFKHVFGGLGRNLLNPAMAAKCVLILLFYDTMTDFGTSQYTDPSPLVLLNEGQTPDLMSMLTGNVAGCIGTSSAAAVLVSAAILLFAGIIDLTVPVSAIIGFSACYLVIGEYGTSFYTQCVQLCGGGFFFTIFIMAEDYTTSPLSRKARIVYGLLMGAVTAIFRQFGFAENACVYALLLVNVLRPLLDRTMAPVPFGASASKWIIREPKKSRSAQTSSSRQEALQEERDEAFEQFEQQIARQTGGSETARYDGDDPYANQDMNPRAQREYRRPLRQSAAGAGAPGGYGEYPADGPAVEQPGTGGRSPVEGESGSWTTAPAGAGMQQGYGGSTGEGPAAGEPAHQGASSYGRPLPKMPTMPQWNPRGYELRPDRRPQQDTIQVDPYAGIAVGTPGEFESVVTDTSAIQPAAIHAAVSDEEVSRDTDMWEVAAIIRAEQEMHRSNEEQFANLQFMDLGEEKDRKEDKT